MRMPTPLIIIIFRFLSALPFAIFYSSLQLYLLNIGFSKNTATSLVGSVLALSFGLSLIGGYLAKKNFSYRGFLIFSIICHAAGCFAFSTYNHNLTLWLICLFLLGSVGINVSLNMLLTQCYDANDYSREKSFFWLYMFLNLGYLAGYTLAGYYGNLDQYYKLPIIVISTTGIVLLLMLLTWKHVDKPKQQLKNQPYYVKDILVTALLMVALYILIRILLSVSQITNAIIIGGWIIISTHMMIKLIKHYPHKRKEIFAFYVLLFAALIFWSAYFLAPMALIVFIKHHVNLNLMGVKIAPQWVQNINTVSVIIGTFILGTKSKNIHSPIPFLVKQFSLGLFSLGLGFLLLVIGILLTSPGDKVGLSWVILSYILQSIGELLIGPIGYSLIGRLIPHEHQSLMMGVWVTLLGVAGAIASKLSIFAPYSPTHLFTILHLYKGFFSYIGFGVIIISILIYFGSKKIIKPQQPA